MQNFLFQDSTKLSVRFILKLVRSYVFQVTGGTLARPVPEVLMIFDFYNINNSFTLIYSVLLVKLQSIQNETTISTTKIRTVPP